MCPEVKILCHLVCKIVHVNLAFKALISLEIVYNILICDQCKRLSREGNEILYRKALY